MFPPGTLYLYTDFKREIQDCPTYVKIVEIVKIVKIVQAVKITAYKEHENTKTGKHEKSQS